MSFFGSSDTVKKQVISRFSGAVSVNPVFKSIEADITKVTNEITTISADINRSEGMILAYQKQIEELVDYDPEKERAKNIKALEDLNEGRQKTIDWKNEESAISTANHLANFKNITLWENRLKALVYPYTEAETEILEIKQNAQAVWDGHKKDLKECLS